MTANKNKAQPERNTAMPLKKPQVVQYNKHTNKAEIRSVTPENVQECLKDPGLDFSKCNKLKL